MLLIKNATWIDGLNEPLIAMDILVKHGVIEQIGKGISCASATVIDADGCWVMPGLIDAHCHLREPGFEYKEDIYSGTRSAAMGGFTQVACMANTQPVIDNAALVEFVQQKSIREGVIKVHVIGAITKGLSGNELTNMGELKEAGVVALSNDGKPVENASIMKLALEYAKAFDLLLISHCEETSLARNGSVNEGYASTISGLKGISRAAEEIMVARDIILAETLHTSIHIAHVSTRGSVEHIRMAKARGVKVTCETAPHYFSATDDRVLDYDSNTKVNPPLRTWDDVSAIKEGLRDGTIDIIATDHAPHHRDEKEVEYEMAANGFSGFETALSLAITHLIKPGILSVRQLVEKMAKRPAEILKVQGGFLEKGSPADIIIVDPTAEYLVNAELFISKGKNSPFHGQLLTGKVKYTIINGDIIIDNGQLIK